MDQAKPEDLAPREPACGVNALAGALAASSQVAQSPLVEGALSGHAEESNFAQLETRNEETSGHDEWTLAEFARLTNSSEHDVWQMLRRGELIGRTYRGRLYVSRGESHADAAPLPSEPSPSLGHDDSLLPPLPGGEDAFAQLEQPLFPKSTRNADEPEQIAAKSSAPLSPQPMTELVSSPLVATQDGQRTPAEVALLIDHLSLAKEESREILRLTQDSIRRMSTLTDTIVEMKNAVIEAKETEVLALREQLAARDAQIKGLLQQKEDLEMLARMLADSKTQAP